MEGNDEVQDDLELKTLFEKAKISPAEACAKISSENENLGGVPNSNDKDALLITSVKPEVVADEEGTDNKEKGPFDVNLTVDDNLENDPNIELIDTSSQGDETLIKETPKNKDDDKEHICDTDEKKQNFRTGYEQFYGHRFEDFVLKDEEGRKFNYYYSSKHCLNQERYEKIGEAVNDYIYNLLESRCNMERHFVPPKVSEEQRGFFFASAKALETTDKLLILIHGSGVVRAGQWARRIILNDNLMDGSQIPYIEQAYKEDYEVVVLNTNQNYINNKQIKGSECPVAHALYVWKNFIMEAKAKHIAIMAHSYGGHVTVSLANKETESFLKKVFAVAFSDSVHSSNDVKSDKNVKEFFRKHARNWVASDKKLDETVSSGMFSSCFSDDVKRVSAGHTKHEWTSAACMKSVFEFFEEQLHDHMSMDRNSMNSNASGIRGATFLETETPTSSETCDIGRNYEPVNEKDVQTNLESNNKMTENTISPDDLQIADDRDVEVGKCMQVLSPTNAPLDDHCPGKRNVTTNDHPANDSCGHSEESEVCNKTGEEHSDQCLNE